MKIGFVGLKKEKLEKAKLASLRFFFGFFKKTSSSSVEELVKNVAFGKLF